MLLFLLFVITLGYFHNYVSIFIVSITFIALTIAIIIVTISGFTILIGIVFPSLQFCFYYKSYRY